jgi:hypothetical protein
MGELVGRWGCGRGVYYVADWSAEIGDEIRVRSVNCKNSRVCTGMQLNKVTQVGVSASPTNHGGAAANAGLEELGEIWIAGRNASLCPGALLFLC